MKSVKWWIKDLVIFVLQLTIGIVFLISREAMANIAIVLFGIVFIILGMRDVYTYCSESAEEAAAGANLFTGLTFILLGLLCTIGSTLVYSIISVYLPFAFGSLMLLLGLMKLQGTVDELRLHKKTWWIHAILTAIIVAVSIVVLINPFSTDAAFIFIGVAFIVEATFTLSALIVLWRLSLVPAETASVAAKVVEPEHESHGEKNPEPTRPSEKPSDETTENN